MDVKEITNCCGPVLAAPLAEADAEELAAAFKVVADPVRRRYLFQKFSTRVFFMDRRKLRGTNFSVRPPLRAIRDRYGKDGRNP